MSVDPSIYQFQWIWEGASQLASDNYVNTWHFRTRADEAVDFDNVRDLLLDFYTGEADGQSNPIIDYMSNTSISGTYTIKAYKLSDPKPRYPEYETTDSVSPGGGTALPTECSTVFSFQAERVAGEKQSRRRNRVYLGPFDVSANEQGYVKPSLVENLLFAGKGLFNAAESAFHWSWIVYSPSNEEWYPIDNGWVDNGWDTQCRRGWTATARGSFDGAEPT